MKRLLLFIILVFDVLALRGQSAQHYLVFTFNRRYECEGFKHGTADHVWIIPYDSCKDGICEKDMKPLFMTDFQLYCLHDSTNYDSCIGEYPIIEYSRRDPIVWQLYKSRRLVQKKKIKTFHLKSKDVLQIYCVPIIAKCSTHEYGYNHIQIVTINDEPQIWDNFWSNLDRDLSRKILLHDFSGFDYIVSMKLPNVEKR